MISNGQRRLSESRKADESRPAALYDILSTTVVTYLSKIVRCLGSGTSTTHACAIMGQRRSTIDL